jgi:hypothetical protein
MLDEASDGTSRQYEHPGKPSRDSVPFQIRTLPVAGDVLFWGQLSALGFQPEATLGEAEPIQGLIHTS